ncbi:MAG: hypothetical protein WAM26_01300 [Nitrososphaeraceae archaeon]
MQQDHMSNCMLNLFVTVVVVQTSITVFNYNMIFASFGDDDDNDKPILPNYREGYEVGKVQGSKDNISGNEHNDGCPSGDRNILYCIGYEIGYNDGYYGNSNTEDNMTRD